MNAPHNLSTSLYIAAQPEIVWAVVTHQLAEFADRLRREARNQD